MITSATFFPGDQVQPLGAFHAKDGRCQRDVGDAVRNDLGHVLLFAVLFVGARLDATLGKDVIASLDRDLSLPDQDRKVEAFDPEDGQGLVAHGALVVRSYNGFAGYFSVNAERPVPGDLRTWELAFGE